MSKSHALISCFYDNLSTDIFKNDLPIGFSWIATLSNEPYKDKYKLTMLLHGECLKYGLNSESYQSVYGTDNPYGRFLKNIHERGVKIIICKLCLIKDGFSVNDLIHYIRPIPFSIDYILQYQRKCDHAVVYDAQIKDK
jgi:hypothetical protein